MDILLVGDVHGKIQDYLKLTRNVNRSIQVGDMGVGFRGVVLPHREGHSFIRGNHDGPTACRNHPSYLGDYGVTPEGIFFVSGANSVDKDQRTPGLNWWADEQLDEDSLQKALDLYIEKKPEIVISHDCPWSIVVPLVEKVNKEIPWTKCFGPPKPYPTTLYLEEMLKGHRPKKWIFGHYHIPFQKEQDGTLFRCLDIEETMSLTLPD